MKANVKMVQLMGLVKAYGIMINNKSKVNTSENIDKGKKMDLDNIAKAVE